MKNNSTADYYKQRKNIEEEKSCLDKQLLSAQQSFELDINIAQDSKHLADLQNAEQDNNSDIALLEEQQKAINFQLNEAQQAFNLLQAESNQSVKQLRAALLTNKPCSVCGSENHPWADNDNPLQQPIAEKDNTIKLLAEQGSLQAQHLKDLSSCQAKIASDIIQQKTLGFASPISADFIAQLNANQADINLRFTAAQENEAQALLLQKQWNDSRIALEQHREKHNHHKDKVTQLTEQIKLDSLQKQALENDVSRETSKKEELIKLLSSAFSLIEDWQSLVFEETNFIKKFKRG